IPVELTYVGTGSFPRSRGVFDLESPRLDAPLKGARWEVFLPADYSYSKFGGTMTRESAASAGEASSFSILEYAHRESKAKAEQVQELKADLWKAKSKLSAGNVKEAFNDYKRARNNGNFVQNDDAEAKQLEEQLRRAQGSNLINAQNAFSAGNAAKGA